MANNNYAGFNYGGTQYNSGQVSYPAVTNATYANAAAYQSAAAAAGQGGGYAATGSGSGSGGGGSYGGYGEYRNPTSYDGSKTFYQQSPASYNASGPAAAGSKTHYSAPPVKNNAKGGKMDKSNGGPKPPNSAPPGGPANNYSGYDSAVYNAASMYVNQQHQGGPPNKPNGGNNWYPRKMGPAIPGPPALRGLRPKAPPRPQQLHYCEVCKISCAGPQTYREHLEGQKHKKREASLKMSASATSTTQNRGNNYHCELCDVTCTGTDAYAAHVRGAKHQKVVKLHQKLGKPIPSEEPKKLGKINFVPAAAGGAAAAPAAAGTGAAAAAATPAKTEGAEESEAAGEAAAAAAAADNLDDNQDDSCGENTDNIKPVGGEYIEEVKDDEHKILSFNCKLCDCKFNDPNAKEMHMKGRRHRLQYKRKVQPDLVVDFKPTPRQRRLAEARAQRALMSHRGGGGGDEHEGSGNYWEEQRNRQYNEEYDYNNWMSRSFGGAQRFGRIGSGPPPHFGMMPGGNLRRPESTDDRHAIARHAEIYPKEEELQTIQRIVSHTERALKLVSDALTDQPNDPAAAAAKKDKPDKPSEKDGRDNQIFSFHKDADSGGVVRILKGVMRVGYLAKGLLLHGDNAVELVVLCAEKPTVGLLQRVATKLPDKLKDVAGDMQITYRVEVNADDAAVIVLDETVSVKITLTSPLLREGNVAEIPAKQEEGEPATTGDAELLPREPCLRALADLRHAKWFQARATGLQSCVMVIRILRDLCQRVPSWQALPQWSLELLVEKVISSAAFPISPGDCMRRIMEALSSGFLINGPGLLDPCEKDPTDALVVLSKQEREDLTVSAQQFLRFIAFRQIFKVLGMDQLPAMKFPVRPWRINRKRRRSSGKAGASGTEAEAAEIEETGSDEKVPKKDGAGAAAATASSPA
ncbi:zinc finger RNA-binding protein isoform X1 [Drosophila guanche]|uniref:Blast:Zinc finger RNA-binding protein n=1 Tax=Drosophila guanche TaxID=7266 RepID=A0A3B0JR51_DROGU|nr:zinc finger RNA-binding protein isoform X1 [Drosophila guanche]SPP84644.1 blast:Zinc finger RNA-binding protein [Drosophila guanche]